MYMMYMCMKLDNSLNKLNQLTSHFNHHFNHFFSSPSPCIFSSEYLQANSHNSLRVQALHDIGNLHFYNRNTRLEIYLISECTCMRVCVHISLQLHITCTYHGTKETGVKLTQICVDTQISKCFFHNSTPACVIPRAAHSYWCKAIDCALLSTDVLEKWDGVSWGGGSPQHSLKLTGIWGCLQAAVLAAKIAQ